MIARLFVAIVALVCLAGPVLAENPNYTRKEDVIYGRKFGLAMTMDVYTPREKPNGRGIIWCVSGGWFSFKPEGIWLAQEFIDRGYVVFAVVHGSQPKFTIPEVLDDMHRAVRYIKTNSRDFGVKPDALGMTGWSAGGHLSMMQGCAPRDGNPNDADSVGRESSKVAAVACFYGPTDFLNYGKEGQVALGDGVLKDFPPPFEFWERDQKSNRLRLIDDPDRRKEIGKQISPIYHVSKQSAPTLIIHGDADTLVPIQQAESIIAKFKQNNVPCELVVRRGAAHGGPAFANDEKIIADWFDKYLKEK